MIGLGFFACTPLVRAKIYPSDQVDKLPRWLDQPPPHYPFDLRKAGVMGEAVIRFVLDEDGRMSRCEVVAQTNPEFGRTALDSVRQWRAKPGIKDGRKVELSMQIPILFSLDDGSVDKEATAYMFGFPVKVPSQLPAEFHYNVQPQAMDTPAPVYPYDDWMENRPGSAEVTYVIDPEGRLQELHIINASAPEFGQALAAAIERWKFKPATHRGKPCFAPARLDFHFNLYQPDDAPEIRLRKAARDNPAALAKMSGLDQPLQPTNQVAPRYPFALVNEGLGGQAVVECIVDREGWVRLPHVISATRGEFGQAAAAALTEWRFAVPRVKGTPSDVVVRVPFNFAALK
jgi:TonB family protein